MRLFFQLWCETTGCGVTLPKAFVVEETDLSSICNQRRCRSEFKEGVFNADLRKRTLQNRRYQSDDSQQSWIAAHRAETPSQVDDMTPLMQVNG